MGAPLSFQRLILTLHDYWSTQGCLILQPYDMEMGAGTFHPATTLRVPLRAGSDPMIWMSRHSFARKRTEIEVESKKVKGKSERQ